MSSVIMMMFIVHVVHVEAMGTRVVIIGNKKACAPPVLMGCKGDCMCLLQTGVQEVSPMILEL